MEAAMSGKSFELDSNFLPKNKRVSRVDDDRISQLPDDIIVHILSFLPLKKAAGTSVLSRRWSHLWKYTPNLNFVNDFLVDPMINIPVFLPTAPLPMPESDEWIILLRSLKNIAWVNSVLDSYEALSLKQLEISFHLCTDSCSQLLTKWLHFAFSRRVESLKLCFASAPYTLNANILRSSMESRSGCRLFLGELRLERLSVSSEAIEWFLQNCPLLEVLIIDRTSITSDLKVVGGMLKHLEVLSSDNDISFRVSAPNLTRLTYSFDLRKLFLKNVSNLVEASFFLSGSLDAMRRLTKAAPRLETLTITLSYPSALPVPQMLKLNKLVKLVLEYSTVNEDFLLPVTCFLHASPCLQEFRLKINDRLYNDDFFFEGGIFEVPKMGGSPHHHLNVFEFSGFAYDADDHMELVSYIVDNCVALEEMIIIPICPSFCLEIEISPGVVLPSSFSANPYVVKHRVAYDPAFDPTYNPNFAITPRTVDHDEIASELRDASLNIKKYTEQLLAGKVPRHIKLLVV